MSDMAERARKAMEQLEREHAERTRAERKGKGGDAPTLTDLKSAMIYNYNHKYDKYGLGKK